MSLKTTILYMALFFFPLYYFHSFLAYSENLPWSDDYHLLRYISQSREQRIRQLFSTCDDHRVVTARLIGLAVNRVNQGLNFRYLIITGNLSLIGIFLIFLLCWKKYRMPLYAFPAVSAFLFSPFYWEVNVWALATLQNVMIHFFVILALWCRYHCESRLRWPLTVLAGLLAVFTRADGLLIFAVFAIMAILEMTDRANRPQKNLKIEIAALSLLFAVLLLFLVIIPGYQEKLSPLPGVDLPSRLLDIAYFVILLLGGIFVDYHALSIITGVALILLFFLCLLPNIRKKYPVFASLAIFQFISVLAIGYGRVYRGPDTAQASWYMLNPMLLIICIYALLLVPGRWISGKKLISIHLCLFVIVGYNFFGWINRAEGYYMHSMKEARLLLNYLLEDSPDGEEDVIRPEPTHDREREREREPEPGQEQMPAHDREWDHGIEPEHIEQYRQALKDAISSGVYQPPG